MKEQLFEELAKRHPDLFQKAEVQDFECDDGWYNILDTLCGLISSDVKRARTTLEWCRNKNDGIIEAEETLKQALENLPIIQQVKEKFGGLRFYTDRETKEVGAFIRFAEEIAEITCEQCGAPGEKRNTGWIKVRCDKHQREKELADSLADNARATARNPRFATRLSDESSDEN